MIDFFFPPKPTRIWPDAPLLKRLEQDPEYDCEIKYNDWRLLLFKQAGTITLFNSNGTVIDIDPAPFVPHFKKVPDGTVFDGGLIDKRTKMLKYIIVLWDTCFYHHVDLRHRRLNERRPYLETHFDIAPPVFKQMPGAQVYRTGRWPGDFRAIYDEVETRANDLEEGIVIKKITSTYKSHPARCLEILDWFKVKKIGDHALVNKE